MPQEAQEPRKRGLGALLSSTLAAPAQGLSEVPVDYIDPSPQQPRTEFAEGAIQELTESIRANGLLQPVVLRPAPGGRYFLIAGERRWRAAQRAGLARIPAVVRETADFEALELSLVENLQREDLNPLEAAKAYRLLIDHFERTQEEVARAVGKDRSTIANALRLLDLPLPVQSLLAGNKITPGHARALLALKSERRQEEVAHSVVKAGLSVRQTEQLIYRRPRARFARLARSPLEERLTEFLGCRVSIARGRRKSKLIIEFHGDEALSGILERIGLDNG